MSNNLVINNLNVAINDKKIINNLSLNLNKGEITVVLGPNGSGKTTLFKSIFSHYSCSKLSGKIILEGQDITKLSPNLIAKKGLFLSFQNPFEVHGVKNLEFLKEIINEKNNKKISVTDLYMLLKKQCNKIEMPQQLINRNINEGLSGGEKKKNELLQILLLEPNYIFLDEIDSGLDSSALQIIGQQINELVNQGKSITIITHQLSMIDLVKPKHVYVMVNGSIVEKGDIELARKINQNGYQWIYEKYNITPIVDDFQEIDSFGAQFR